MKTILDLVAAALLVTAIATAHAEGPKSPDLTAAPASADKLITSLLSETATYRGQTPRGVRCTVSVTKAAHGHKVVIVRDADQYEASETATFTSIGDQLKNTRAYAVSKSYVDVSGAFTDFFFKTQTVQDAPEGSFGIDELVNHADLSIGLLRSKLNSVSISHDSNEATKRGQYETCGWFTSTKQ